MDINIRVERIQRIIFLYKKIFQSDLGCQFAGKDFSDFSDKKNNDPMVWSCKEHKCKACFETRVRVFS